jgi:hypothetical protein
MRQSYLASLAPSATENALNIQLADLNQQINQTELNRDAGIAKVDSQTIMQAFKTGQDAAITKQANLALKSLNDSYNNLTARLNIATKARETTTTALGAGLDFLSQDIATMQAAKTALDNEEDKLIDRFDKYSDKQKEDAALVLEALAGVDPSTLSPQAQAQIANIAGDLGIAPSDLISALQNQYDATVLEAAQKATASTQIIERAGRQILINKDTGEDIKDLGAIYVAPKSSGSSGGGGSSKPTATEVKNSRISAITSEFNQHLGKEDGYLDTAVYERLIKANPDLRSIFPPEEWLNPKDSTALKFFQSSAAAIAQPKDTTKAEDADMSVFRGWLESN